MNGLLLDVRYATVKRLPKTPGENALTPALLRRDLLRDDPGFQEVAQRKQ
jgi:hypothetical protein